MNIKRFFLRKTFLFVFIVTFWTKISIFQKLQFIIPRALPQGGPAFIIRGGPNSEHFLSNLRKLLKRGKFFLTTQSLIVKRNWIYINKFIKILFLIKKKNVYLLNTFLSGFFLKTKLGMDPEISRKKGGELIWLDMVYFMIILPKRGR